MDMRWVAIPLILLTVFLLVSLVAMLFYFVREYVDHERTKRDIERRQYELDAKIRRGCRQTDGTI